MWDSPSYNAIEATMVRNLLNHALASSMLMTSPNSRHTILWVEENSSGKLLEIDRNIKA